jgi:hypothetical protein
MSAFHRHPLILAAVCLALPVAAHAQTWEGTIRTREISFDVGLFSARVGDDPERILEIPLADILAARERPDAGDFAFSLNAATLKLKGPRVRTDLTGEVMAEMGVGFGVMNVDEGMMYMVIPEQQMIVEMNIAEIEELMQGIPRPEPGPPPEVETLGQTRVVNGVRCAGYRIRSASEVTVAWVSDADRQLHAVFQRFADLVRKMDPTDVDPELLLAQYGFPMLSYTINGTSVQIEETLAIERGAVPDSEFALPADYQRTSMLDMMRQQMEQIRR